MCGIVGYIGSHNAVDVLLPSLKRLEYRGYDSSGVATVDGRGLEVRRSIGKIANLEGVFAELGSPGGSLGIAHTRWATHGRPCEMNAHPHVDCDSRFAVVHNGIIENHEQLRAALIARGHRFRSQTDTEVIAHLIESYGGSDLPDAISRAVAELRGSYAIACISKEQPDMLVAVRGGGSPLVVGIRDGEGFVASDIPALVGRSSDVVVLEDGDMAVLTRGQISIRRLDGRTVSRASTPISLNEDAIERNGYPHFMLKEIFEQPEAVRSTLAGRIDRGTLDAELDGLALGERELASLSRLVFIACGTSWHAALVGRYLIEDWARLSAEAEIASELRHRHPVSEPGLLAVPISQSGETADTLAASRQVHAQGSRVVAISNIVGSSLAREADGVLYTRAGLEIGVAATKTFTSQLAAITLLALKIARARGAADRYDASQIIDDLLTAPSLMETVLQQNEWVKQIAERLADRKDFLYLGRGLHYPMALEGALKLKEIAYVHAEGFPAGELKHGPIALIESGTPVIAIAACNPTLASMASNIQEVKARDAMVVAIVTEGDEATGNLADIRITIPRAPYWLQPFLVAIPLQLLAYHLAVLSGADVDQPRNLAKSVTVE
ncbi:MAG TPA: glutamine--fructose-6-phosphate transaminase (isomerizing) [Vicinamibacterales bacterium]|jgi:glucosamine--fructose-6-phosphate aminotransferase (isomerizing)|nr:glutamine--fructose-6-phosphate transaminase (isomerizing) [Vicinamibacterales bacterium]